MKTIDDKIFENDFSMFKYEFNERTYNACLEYIHASEVDDGIKLNCVKVLDDLKDSYFDHRGLYNLCYTFVARFYNLLMINNKTTESGDLFCALRDEVYKGYTSVTGKQFN